MTLNAISITYCWNSGPIRVGSVIDSWNVCNQFDNIKCNIDNLLLKCYKHNIKSNTDNLYDKQGSNVASVA